MSAALAALQSHFLQHLAGAPSPVLAMLDDGHGVAAGLGLGIYAHAYGARLREALGNDHAALAALLGEHQWRALADAFIAAQPSRQRSLRHFGNGLPAFLATSPGYAERSELAELAAFERALLDSFDAADAPVAAWESLLALPADDWPALCPAFVPSLHFFASSHEGVALWLAHRDGASAAAAGHWAIWRDEELVTRFRSLEPSEAALLAHFLDGRDFASACELLLRWEHADAVPARALGLLGQWCADGWISRFGG